MPHVMIFPTIAWHVYTGKWLSNFILFPRIVITYIGNKGTHITFTKDLRPQLT